MSENRFSRVPTLTQYCYRFINSHLDSILSLGDTPYSLCEPILRSCSAEQLLSLEKNSPHLEIEDQVVWQSVCFRDFPRSEAQYEKGEFSEPECWRKQYFICRRSEEKRLEEVGTRIRSRREEVDQEKKERQVIFTDRLPPAKRSRFNAVSSKSKTLFEKTRAESVKIQRLVYGPATLPPMSTKTVKPRLVPPSKFAHPSSTISTLLPQAGKPLPPNKLSGSNREPTARSSQPSTSLSTTQSQVTPPAGAYGGQKDPMATLFMPKHRAHSQLSTTSPLPMRRK